MLETVRLWRNNPEIRKYMYNQDEISIEQHLNFIKGLSQNEEKCYWLVKKNNCPIGVVNIIEFNKSELTAQLGYYLSPEYIDSGIGIEFISTILSFLFDKIKLNRIFGRTDLNNKNALIINHHLGFRARPHIVLINEIPFVEQDITSSEFNKRRDFFVNPRLLAQSLKEFNTIYKQLKLNSYGN